MAVAVAAPAAPSFAYRRTTTPPALVPGRALHLVYLTCKVHISPAPDTGSATGLPAAQSSPSCTATRGASAALASWPAGRWLAATFHLVPDAPASSAARTAVARWRRNQPPRDRVLLVTTTDDAPPVIDDGCQHVHHPCDPGPRRVIDEGHHTTTALYVLGKPVPLDLDASALGDLLGLLGYERVALPAGGALEATPPAGLAAFITAP